MEDKLNEIIESMEDYLKEVGDECNYNKKTINKFMATSMNYLKKIKNCKNKEEFEEITIDYIEELNNLNEECDFELIETDQRELIVSMIEDLSEENNFEFEGDFTEVYRQW
jgi:hypothetical protein